MEGDIDHNLAAGQSFRRQGDSGRARAAFGKAESQALEAGDHPRRALALAGLGQIERDGGNRTRALEHYREAAGIWRGLGDGDRLAHTIRHAADILTELGRGVEAEPLYEEALALYRASRGTHPLDLANAIRGYALLLQIKGERENAISHWREARDLYSSAGVESGVAEASRRVALLERGE